MLRRPPARSFVIFAILGLACGRGPCLRAEDAPADPPAAVTTSDADISPDHLKFLVKPLTKDELGVEAAAWRDVLKAKVAEISRLQFEAKQAAADVAAGAEQAAADPAALNKLQSERTLLSDRLRAVLDEWEKKGGDPAEYRAYSSAVSGLDVDVSDAGTTLKVLQGWLFSEQGGLRWAWNIIKFVTILAAFWILSRILSGLVGKAASQIRGTSSLLKTFLINFVRQATLAIGTIVALAAWR